MTWRIIGLQNTQGCICGHPVAIAHFADQRVSSGQKGEGVRKPALFFLEELYQSQQARNRNQLYLPGAIGALIWTTKVC